MRLGSSLAAVGAFALAQSCCTPEPQETREATMEPAAQSAPATPPHRCEQVGADVHHAIMERLRPFGIYGTSGEASDASAQARADCYEEGEMRADCRGVRDRVLQTATFFLDGRETSSPHSQEVEEACLAGYGLAPKKEEAFASRSSDWDPNEPLDPAKIW